MPVSGSTSYFTSTPSPPTAADSTHTHASTTAGQPIGAAQAIDASRAGTEPPDNGRSLGYIAQIEQNLVSAAAAAVGSIDVVTAGATYDLQHSKEHSDILVISRNQFDGMNQRIEQLSRRVYSLEQTLATDVRLIDHMRK